jgi:hypothetical protein
VAPIPEGTAVWRFTAGFDLDLDPKCLEEQPAIVRERLLHYGYIDRRLHRYILCCDGARFIIHSVAAKLRPDFTLEPHGVDIAVVDIPAGAEITVDHRLIEVERSWPGSSR